MEIEDEESTQQLPESTDERIRLRTGTWIRRDALNKRTIKAEEFGNENLEEETPHEETHTNENNTEEENQQEATEDII